MFCDCIWLVFLLSIGWIHFLYWDLCYGTKLFCFLVLGKLPLLLQLGLLLNIEVAYAQEMKSEKPLFLYVLLPLLLLPVWVASHFLWCHVLCWPVPSCTAQVPCHTPVLCIFMFFNPNPWWSRFSECLLQCGTWKCTVGTLSTFMGLVLLSGMSLLIITAP